MNFSIILLILVIITGIAYIGKLYKRNSIKFHHDDNLRLHTYKNTNQVWWISYVADFFWIFLIVFLLRSFLFEPFKIPSASMMPTLIEGDYILVNKFSYGIKLPIIDKKILEISTPKNGDVIVFKYPKDPSVNYIKRVIGVPGDVVEYTNNKTLSLNGKEIFKQKLGDYLHEGKNYYSQKFINRINDIVFNILNDTDIPTMFELAENFPFREHCQISAEKLSCKVPHGHYFVMGDNRDNSKDSRIWGFVPEQNLVGHAFLIWFNANDFSRVGNNF